MSPLPPKLSHQLLQCLYFNVLDLLLTSSMFVEVGGGGLLPASQWFVGLLISGVCHWTCCTV